ncbi:MAG: DsbA family protein [Myxococcales bacterium]|nr:DsbA family protein [Myxococcales bacterium]
MNRDQVSVQYFSDVLCVWAYVGQVRLDELEAAFGASVSVDCHFMTVFGDARGKLHAAWDERGGLPAYAEHVRSVADRFEHVTVHPKTWAEVAPTSSLGCHIFLAAVKLYDAQMFRRAAWSLREAFFRHARDISQRAVQLEVADEIGLPAAELESLLYSGQAHAELSRGLQLARRYAIEVSPSYVFDDGRQRLNGNVGYRVIEANVRELLRAPDPGHSWC